MDAAFQALIASIFSFLFISSLYLLCFLLCHRRRQTPPFQTLNLTAPLPSSVSPNGATNEDFSSFDPSVNSVSYAELAAATDNFAAAAIVGDGGFGFVYKACLSNGVTVAVKKLSSDATFHGFREFRAEMETLAKIRHPNLAKILGFCVSGSDRILIYEFLEKGSLDQWIHEPGLNPLGWETRVRIVRGVANGLAFLHDGCNPCIIHRDIKASNVLLDAEFGSRIADFGLARRVNPEMTHVSTQVAGTMGYMPPEYKNGVTLATKHADVYSFGIVMFEVASGRRPNWPMKGECGAEVWMVKWARGLVEAGRAVEVVDCLILEGLSVDRVKGFLDVAYKCTDEIARKRPSMREVVLMLESLGV